MLVVMQGDESVNVLVDDVVKVESSASDFNELLTADGVDLSNNMQIKSSQLFSIMALSTTTNSDACSHE